LLHLLARHQDAQQRVRDEVAAVVGDGSITGAHIERLEYTTQVIDETLRLCPAAHTVVRHGHDPTTIGGHGAPAGRIVAVSIWGVHHNADAWPDPYRFDPDRFESAPAER
jgi:cytochrome P450